MARWAAARGVPLVHFSTDYVFDGSGERPWREDDPAAPLSVYGASKLAGEENIRAAGGPHLIIRTSWIYAAGGSEFSANDRPVGARKGRVEDCRGPDRCAYFGGAGSRHPGCKLSGKILANLACGLHCGRQHVTCRRRWAYQLARVCVRHCRWIAAAQRRFGSGAHRPDCDKGLPNQVSPAAEFPAGSDTFAG